MTLKLNLTNLRKLREDIVVPTYERASLSAGIVHVGLGNFHRAHQADYLHRLFQTGRDHDWAIIGAGTRPYDAVMRDRLIAQDCLTTIVELDPAGLSAHVSGAMIDYCEIDAKKLIAAMARPEIRIVSLTVTEGGYYVNAKTGGFDVAHPDIVTDAAHPDAPKTVFGIIIAALMARRAAGVPPFTVMTCDNLPDNGHVARNAVLGLARLIRSDAAEWIADKVAFPNSMVDCITPATGARELDLVRERFDVDDAAPVVCEPFRQWVLEDNFPQGRPALEAVGVEFVADVAPYELMKLRVLNGGHAAIAYPSGLLGHHYVHEAMADPLIAAWLDAVEHREIMPTVPPIPNVSLEAYCRTVAGRFANAALGDTIPRLCLDGSNRQPKFILPTIAAQLEKGGSIDGLSLEVALWCHYCAGTADDGKPIELDDPNAERLREHAGRATSDPQAWLSMHDIFGDLAANPAFSGRFAHWLKMLQAQGTRTALQAYIGA